MGDTGQDDSRGIDMRAAASRRTLLIGAVATSAVVSIRPALAQTAGSVLNCTIPVPERGKGMFIDASGKLVSPDTPGAFPPSPRDFTGEEVRQALQGRNLPGASREQSQAYLNYIRKLQNGQSGFTCYASLQMPRR
ncbi:MAG: hypothetical protein ACT6R2_02640 [Blastomonas fulva]|uniref:Uncharacterized protein n=1 Tax=Blastomonas fulva TaxID=1550728 RepID=A0ABM6MBT3_9SPHN|nr:MULTISPECIES: hypothetical protein [Blastomonas]ASR53435.1 hypothetical protein B5J99_09270 [Blastomonas fulva]KPF77049.1 hypothetical protein IP68_02920 [Blastomonas sp. AAP25]MCO5794594.1 hypothetical protein [Blastomonas sp.]MDM7929266.1 hypothetical protein [Blastomonas fulva]MDM7966036.1 hypothetical protein [Blastomonas fulva]